MVSVKEHPVLILDMSTLRFQPTPGRRECRCFTARGEELSRVRTTVDDRGRLDMETTAFHAMDAALGEMMLRHDESGTPAKCSVALYNPFSGEVVLGRLPDSVTVTDGEPVVLTDTGLVAQARTRGQRTTIALAGGRVLEPRKFTYTQLTRLPEQYAS